jgi:truncated hemoglobin YjbI
MTYNNDDNINKCPFDPQFGYVTVATHKEYADMTKNKDPTIVTTVLNTTNENSLAASLDHNQPLHIWQLYSLIGKEPIYEIVSDFYERVYNDVDAPWFRNAFTELAPLHHHIDVQVAYWVDAMGGGRKYPGGNSRLYFHHSHNAKEIMTAGGAKRWMYHMRGALDRVLFEDPRVKPCLVEFLQMKMMRYATEFGWDYEEEDMTDMDQ